MGQFKTLFLGVFCSTTCRQPFDCLTDDGRRFLKFETDLESTRPARVKVADDRVDSNRVSFQVDISRLNRVQHGTHVSLDQKARLAGVDNRAVVRKLEYAPQRSEDVVARVSSAVRSQGLDLPGRLKSPSRTILPPATMFFGRRANELQGLESLVFFQIENL